MADRGAASGVGSGPRALTPVEPVHWGARLVRAPRVVYTEVADTPVLVRVDDAEMQPLPPAWAAVWAALDGRTAAEALDVDPTRVDPVTSRNLIEVLRRLKAKRLVADVDSLEPEDRAAATTPFPDDQPTAGPTDVVLRGHLEQAPGGPVLTLAARPTSVPTSAVLADEQTDLVTVHLTEVEGSVTASVDGEALIVVPPSRAKVAATSQGAEADIASDSGTDGTGTDSAANSEADADAERSVRALAGLLAALDDPTCLARPGVIDLLAALAEPPQGHP